MAEHIEIGDDTGTSELSEGSLDGRTTKEASPVNLFLLITSVGLGVFMAALDESIINVSLPTIKEDLGVDSLRIQWVVLVYLLVIVAVSAGAGYLGDRFSTKLIFQIGMIIFAIGSLMCALSTTLGFLVFARAVQGVGGASLLANGNALVTRFTTDERRGLAIGLTSLVSALAVVIGPVVGALLTQHFKWQVIFWINVPIGVVALIYLQFVIPKTQSLDENPKDADFLGSVFFASFLTTLVLGISLTVDPILPNSNIWSIICISVSLVLFIGFILWERRFKNPFMDFSLFKNKKFTVGLICALVLYVSLTSISYQLPFYLQEVMSYEPIKIGLIIIGVPIGIGITAPLSGRLNRKVDTRVLTTSGLSGIAIALIMAAIFLSPTLHLAIFILIASSIGLAIGFFISPNSNSVMSSVEKEKLGVAGSLLSLSRMVGYTFGTALSTTFLAFFQGIFQNRNGGLLTDAINYTPALRIVLGLFCTLAIISVVFSALRGPDKYIANGKENQLKTDPEEVLQPAK
ncbi:MAG: DHA2 family efflux MFS transporter permease subunit [Candidatus Heimdallarchaeota archaeon]